VQELPKTLLIVYYSNTGKTEKMATNIARGAETAGVNAILKKVENCTQNDLAEADGIAVGSPTYYNNMVWQIKRFMDETILSFYTEGNSLRNKVCGCFTSTGAYSDGKECLRMLELAFGGALKMKIVPGLILESKDVDEGNLASCDEYGQKIAREIT
jgi:multimeric flavodoxin WrbA